MQPPGRGQSAQVNELSAQEFIALHVSALETDEARHNVILGILARLDAAGPPAARLWSLGAPGACALQIPGRPIALGALDVLQCHALADATQDMDYPAVGGPEQAVPTFVERAIKLGAEFEEPVPQLIHALRGSPCYPGAAGHPRLVSVDDAPLLYEWMRGFHEEAVPLDPPPRLANVATSAGEGRFMFWVVDGEPVSVAAIARRTRHAAAISAVYTPPAVRGRGYAGSVVAATVELAYAQGKSMACLYTDKRNPISNRCYAKIGFTPVCPAWHYPRRRPAV
jgi:RimJ/RimL family protein N-acetyltransferase